MSLAENQKRTAQAFINGYNEWTVEGLMRARSDDCIHAMLPASLNRPERTNKDYEQFFQPLSKLMSAMKVFLLTPTTLLLTLALLMMATV